ncbi:c-type cytochrome [Colwellia sp. MB02u-6]|uniref:c-type cytochrome n=1 Tax=Colwellia sp. MB02u-6 TaxID=2759824 RepID=UPI0015F4D42C|nr:c-type cytochrome [Colwellia sp. MB02u-6]MBA6327664.1 c-type cytochrome [Colwellia sp. MB02u-6]
MKYTLLTLLIIMSLTLLSCSKGVDSPRGFSLPKGNIDSGKKVFLKFKCSACHTLNNIKDIGTAEAKVAKHPTITITIGGNKTKIVTYAELVTSVINPSHKFASPSLPAAKAADGKSNMKIFNDVMTVTELIDLVSFLQPNYQLVPYQHTKYQYYPH